MSMSLKKKEKKEKGFFIGLMSSGLEFCIVMDMQKAVDYRIISFDSLFFCFFDFLFFTDFRCS